MKKRILLYYNIENYRLVYSSIRSIKSMAHLRLGRFAKTIFNEQNECENSLISEMLSAEIISDFLQKYYSVRATRIHTEKKIEYTTNSKKTDYILELDSSRIAVQVKRIHDWEDRKIVWNYEKIRCLLEKANILVENSNRNVSENYSWNTQILHIITSQPQVYDFAKSYTKKRKFSFSMLIITYVPKNSLWMVENFKRS